VDHTNGLPSANLRFVVESGALESRVSILGWCSFIANRNSTVYYLFHEPLDWQIRFPQGVGEPEKSLTYLPT
jgi:hypothetical protein